MTLKNITMAVWGLLGLAVFLTALYIGMGRELHRRELVGLYNCNQYGHAMNNWAKQHNEPEVCDAAP